MNDKQIALLVLLTESLFISIWVVVIGEGSLLRRSVSVEMIKIGTIILILSCVGIYLLHYAPKYIESFFKLNEPLVKIQKILVLVLMIFMPLVTLFSTLRVLPFRLPNIPFLASPAAFPAGLFVITLLGLIVYLVLSKIMIK
jgi:magnesium-transporting ATPase (P-type)